MRRITALHGSMRRRRPRGAYFTNTPPLPPSSSLRNPMFITGALSIPDVIPLIADCPAVMAKPEFLPIKNVELAFTLC